MANGPAARAGLTPEAIIVAVDGEAVGGMGDLQRLMSAERIGRAVEITVVHADGHTEDHAVTPEELGAS